MRRPPNRHEAPYSCELVGLTVIRPNSGPLPCEGAANNKGLEPDVRFRSIADLSGGANVWAEVM